MQNTLKLSILLTAAGLIGAAAAGATAAADNVAFVTTPAGGQTDLYVANRDPLLPNPLVKLPIGSIEPRGWLRHQLVLMADGMIGRLTEISPWCKAEGSAWISPKGEGDRGWEELPYWLKGFGDLGYVLKDERIIAEARKWIDGMLASQREDGYFGPRSSLKALNNKPDLWPHMVALNCLQTYYEATGDPRVVPFMVKYFRWQLNLPREDFLPESWGKVRAGDNLESIYWTYNRTGEPWLLDLAHIVHERTIRWDEGMANWHGVNIAQGFREPGIYYVLSKNRDHLDATERNWETVRLIYGQVPGGMYGSDENCRGKYHSPRQGTETCSFVEFMHSSEMLLKFTGDTTWADRCEDVAFNSFPASMTPDLKALHYITCPNQIKLDKANKAPGIQNGGNMFGYSPFECFRCCQHNVSHGWPYFAEHLWMATRDRGLAAAFYAACDVKAKVADGTEVSISETTDYPFDETVALTIRTPKAVAFPLYVRVPSWCGGATLAINDKAAQVAPGSAGYLRIAREWKDGDKVRLTLEMPIRVDTWKTNADSVSVSRGPLTYSLKIGEKWQKAGGTEKWPEWEVFPTTAWNYGLVFDGKNLAASFKVQKKTGPLADQPFTPDAAPLELRAKGKRIPTWQEDHLGLVGLLQASPAKSDQPEEEITLIPMGCARLRIASFPTIGDGPDAHAWVKRVPKHTASHQFDEIGALSDGRVPQNSADKSIRRFTWWDHRGTTEWVTWSFDAAKTVSSCELYWYDDSGTGQCRVPASWKVLYREGEAWKDVAGASDGGLKIDTFNKVTFKPVRTDALKIEVKLQEGYSGGILEWRVR